MNRILPRVLLALILAASAAGCTYGKGRISEEPPTGTQEGIQTPTTPEGEVKGMGGEGTTSGETTGATTVGTTTGGTGTSCQSNSDCPTDQICQAGSCVSMTITMAAPTGTTGPTGATQPKRFTPQNCQNYQYAFVSAYDPVTKQAGAENVYAVPCSDDGQTYPAVKLTTNTDWSSNYKEIRFRPDGAQVAYLFGQGFPALRYIFLDSTVAGQSQYQISNGGSDVGGPFSVFSPTWLDNEKIGYARIDPANNYQLAWQSLADPDHPVAVPGLPSREINSAVWAPPLGGWIFSQKDVDNKFKLYVAKDGEPVRVIMGHEGASDVNHWVPVEGKDPARNPSGALLAFVSGNYVSACSLQLPPYTIPVGQEPQGETIYQCSGYFLLGGDDNNPASSPCWSADGKYLYYEIYSAGVSSIGRVDVNGLFQNELNASVILDEFPGNAGSEMIPGCYPIMNP